MGKKLFLQISFCHCQRLFIRYLLFVHVTFNAHNTRSAIYYFLFDKFVNVLSFSTLLIFLHKLFLGWNVCACERLPCVVAKNISLTPEQPLRTNWIEHSRGAVFGVSRRYLIICHFQNNHFNNYFYLFIFSFLFYQ